MAQPINYQWQVSKDEGYTYSNLIGATGSSLSISGINDTYHNNLYRCALTRNKRIVNSIDVSNYKYSKAARLSVLPDISYSNTENETYDITNGSLSIIPSSIIDNTATINHQWQYSEDNGNTFYNMANETGAQLNISGLDFSQNGYVYRRQTSAYYSSKNIATSYSPNVTAIYQNTLPLLRFISHPQNYYGPSGSAVFSVSVGSGYISGTGSYSPTAVKYCWQVSLDNGDSWINTGDSQPSLVIDNIEKKQFNQYRCNVFYDQSIHGISGTYSVASNPASILTYDQESLKEIKRSEILGLNHYIFKNENGDLGILSNNTSGSMGDMVLFSIDDGYTNKRLIATYAQSIRDQYKNLAIKKISLHETDSQQNTVVTKTTDSSRISDKPKSNVSFDANGNILGNVACIGMAGINYGNGYVININNTINSRALDDLNYRKLIFNSLKKASRTKSSIRVGIISSGRAADDNLVISKLQTIKSNTKIDFYIIDSSTDISAASLRFSTHVILLLNSYNWSSYNMSNTSQENIRLWIKEYGGALVTGEWVLWNTAARRKFSILKDTFPIAPTNRWSSNKILRWYQYSSDAILNEQVSEDFEFLDYGVAGVETLTKNIREGAEIFYISEQIHKSVSPEAISSNNLIENFNLDNVFTLDTAIKNNASISYGGNKYIEGSFIFDPTKLKTQTKVGGLLYWAYKSLVDSYTDQCSNSSSDNNYLWGGDTIGSQADGFSSVLNRYGYETSDFAAEHPNPKTELVGSDFISKYMKLMKGTTPCSNSFITNSISTINRKPTYPVVQIPDSGNVEISTIVSSLNRKNTQHKWYYQPSGSSIFYDLNIDNNPDSYVINNTSGELNDSKYKVESFVDAENKTESIFEIKKDTGISLSIYNSVGGNFNEYLALPTTTISGTPIFPFNSDISVGSLTNKQFTLEVSDDNINFSEVRTRPASSQVDVLNTAQIRKYIRGKLEHNNEFYYSNTLVCNEDFSYRGISIQQSGTSLLAKVFPYFFGYQNNTVSIQNWEYSFDDKNYYSFPNEASGTYKEKLDILSNTYHNAYFRVAYQQQDNNIYFSNSLRFFSPDYLAYERVYLNQTIDSQYVINNKEYVDITIALNNYSGININTVEWYKYNQYNNQYSIINNITGTSISITGISTSHANDISYKAIINHTGSIYL